MTGRLERDEPHEIVDRIAQASRGEPPSGTIHIRAKPST